MLQYSPLPQKDFMRPVLETTPADLVGPIEFSVYGQVSQLIIDGGIIAGHPEKDRAKQAEHLWNFHAKRGHFRLQISAD